jgi:hypothetical protein
MFGASPIRPLSFSEVLDDIVEEAQLGRSQHVRANRTVQPDMDWFFQLLAMAAKPQPAEHGSTGAGAGFYGEEIGEIVAPRDDEAGIAEELALSRVGSLAELKQIRRAFALRNHPDLLHPAVQAWATRRMKIANMLIDRRGKELALERDTEKWAPAFR